MMHEKDQIHTSFITDKGMCYYQVMPFGLKNIGSTCQKFVNTTFEDKISSNIEVYIDDMVVKSFVSAARM